MSGSALLEFCERLDDSWQGLADILEIPPADRAKFERGNEARRIVGWLTSRRRLHELVAAVEEAGRSDLSGVVAEIVRDDSAASARRRIVPPRSVQQFEILFLSTQPDLEICEVALRAAIEMTNAVALQPTIGYRFLANRWSSAVHANASSPERIGFHHPGEANDTVVVVIRRNPPVDALKKLRALLETETARALVLVFPDAQGDTPDTAASLNAAREDHRVGADWIDLPADSEQAVALAMAAIVGRLIVEIITRGSSGPENYVETR